MGVERIDYLIWGAKVNPDEVEFDKHEAEIYLEDGRRFDLIYDGMCGEYAVAGKVICASDPINGLEFTEISDGDWDFRKEDLIRRVRDEFPDAKQFGLKLFSHFH